MKEGKEVDAQHGKVKIVVPHKVSLLVLRNDGHEKVGRPGDGEAQHDNQDHLAHLVSSKDTIVRKCTKIKSTLTFLRLTSCLRRLPCLLRTEVLRSERAMQKHVKAMSISGMR